jgi:hypothetical protein
MCLVVVVRIYWIFGTDAFGSLSHLALITVMGLFASLFSFSFVYFVIMLVDKFRYNTSI